MNLRDESEACALPHQERAGTGIFALCLPSQVVAQGFAQSFLLIMDRVEQESPGTPAGERGTKLPCISALWQLWTEPTGPPGTQTWLPAAHGGYLATPPVQQHQGRGHLWMPWTQTRTPQKVTQTHLFFHQSPNHPWHSRATSEAPQSLQHPSTIQIWTRTTGSWFILWAWSPLTLRDFENRIQGSNLRSLVLPLFVSITASTTLQMNTAHPEYPTASHQLLPRSDWVSP